MKANLRTTTFRPAAKRMQLFAVALGVFYAVGTMVRGPGSNAFWDIYVNYTVEGLAIALCFARAYLIKDNERRAWFAMGSGMLLWSLGDIYWTLIYSVSADDASVSWADVGYLAFYPFVYTAIMMLIRARTQKTPRSIWLDGLVGGLATASVCAALVFKPIVENTTGSTLYVIVNLAYPSADLLMLVLVICTFALSGWRPDRSWVFLGMALCLLIGSDTGYLYQTATNSYSQGTILDAGWPIAMVMVGLSAWRRPRKVETISFESWLVVAIPFLFAVIALGVLSGHNFWSNPSLDTVLAFASITTGFVRMGLTFKEVRSLSESRREARTDELTNLGNRRYFYENLEKLLHHRRDDKPLALLLIDLDHFKEVNDSLGHHFGDRLLRNIGPRLHKLTSETDLVARLGGDEFTIVIETADAADAVDMAEKVRQALDTPFELDGVPVKIGASIGIAVFPDHGHDAHSLLRHADVAMYGAKESRGRHRVYEPSHDEHTRDRLNTINELRQALNEKRLVVHYQPKITADGKFAGAEALVRLRNLDGRLVPPDNFLPLAEQAGLISVLTTQVLNQVLTDISKWHRAGRKVKVAVNLSVTNLLDNDFPAEVAHALQAHRLPGRCLSFEITETIVLTDPERALTAVKRLRSLGADTSLDDYGTGYASIAYLRQMPLNELKLDRSFVSNLESDEVARSFFTSTVTLAHVLGLSVVAEGIETPEMWQAARAAGCDIGQGYLFSYPVPASEFVGAVANMLKTVRALGDLPVQSTT